MSTYEVQVKKVVKKVTSKSKQKLLKNAKNTPRGDKNTPKVAGTNPILACKTRKVTPKRAKKKQSNPTQKINKNHQKNKKITQKIISSKYLSEQELPLIQVKNGMLEGRNFAKMAARRAKTKAQKTRQKLEKNTKNVKKSAVKGGHKLRGKTLG